LTRLFLLGVLAAYTCTVRAEDATQLDGNLTLFSVMAALNAAGFDADAGSPANHPLRVAVRDHLQAKKLPSVSRIRNFIESHKKKDPAADLAQYVSFALISGEPPAFTPRFTGTEVPPDVEALEGFHPLMVTFHQEAGIDELWRKVQPEMEKALSKYHEPVSRSLLEVNAYLRNATSGYMGRRFLVYVDLLAPPNQVQTRSYQDDYFIVLTSSAEPRVADIRHAYLHYLLDPLATKYAEKIEKSKSLIDFALGAPALDESYKSDFLLLATESLIKAIESRISKSPQAAEDALKEGFILTPFFAERLPLYEKQEAAMRLHFPEMIDELDFRKESKRLDNVQFAAKRTQPVVTAKPAVEAPVRPEIKALEEAEKLYAARDLEPAREKFFQILKLSDDKPVHARVYYGLARVAVLQKNLDTAEQLFRKTLDMSPDPHTRAWTEVYLGRLNENTDTPQNALEHYKAALSIDGAPPGARKAAEEGIRKVGSK
jgi:predicted negative regulator of RcsB-dependent stress response